MALYKRKTMYWVNISHNGERIQRSTGTSDKIAAQQFHDKFKSQLWHESRLDELPNKTWMDAVIRWLNESTHKRSLDTDKCHLRWLDPHLKGKQLKEINRKLIDKIADIKSASDLTPLQ